MKQLQVLDWEEFEKLRGSEVFIKMLRNKFIILNTGSTLSFPRLLSDTVEGINRLHLTGLVAVDTRPLNQSKKDYVTIYFENIQDAELAKLSWTDEQ